MEENFIKFIRKHHLLTLATVNGEGMPYVANCFYAYDKERNLFIFTSDMATRHGQEMASEPRVALSVVLETRVVGRVQGLQITGQVGRATDSDKTLYLKRFPYAVVADLTLWRLEADMMKLTDNTLGFGKKLIWHRQQ